MSEHLVAQRAAEHKRLAAALGQPISDEKAMSRALLELGPAKVTPIPTPLLDVLRKRS
jgi:hypothetical protein